MKLVVFLLASLLVAILCMAYAARGPDEMIVNALIVWGPPAFLAFVVRNKASAFGRYVAPAIALAVMLALMLSGMGAI
jgi:hypothetical protein